MALPNQNMNPMGQQQPQGPQQQQATSQQIPPAMTHQPSGAPPPLPGMTYTQSDGTQGMRPPPQYVGPTAPGLTSPTKEVNTATLCRIGQETVQEIVGKTLETFQNLKAISMPNGVSVNMQTFSERRAKIEDLLKNETVNFKKLRLIHGKVAENCALLENKPPETLIPYEDEEDQNKLPMSETLQYISEEHKECVEQLRLKSRQLKEIIDQLRTIIWEINTMIAMRKT